MTRTLTLALAALLATAARAQDADPKQPPAPPAPTAAPSSMSEQRKADLKRTVERSKARRARLSASAARRRDAELAEAAELDRQSLALAVEQARREAVAYARQAEQARTQALRDVARAVDANTYAAQQAAQAGALARPIKLRGTLARTPGGWTIVAFGQALRLLDTSKYEQQAWFKDKAEVVAVGTIALDATTPAGQAVPFDLESLKPAEDVAVPAADAAKAGKPR